MGPVDPEDYSVVLVQGLHLPTVYYHITMPLDLMKYEECLPHCS